MYEMAIYCETEQIEPTLRAEIKSTQLDSMLHPSGVAIVYFDTSSEIVKKARKVLIDSFQLDSLAEYLGSQPVIRDLLGQGLYLDYLSRVGSKPSIEVADIWNVARVVSISFSKPQSWSTSDQKLCIAPMEQSDKISDMHFQLASSDLNVPSAKSNFIVEIDASWDRSHGPKLAYFKNGILDSLTCISG